MENKDQEITGMNMNMHSISAAVDIAIWTCIEDISAATRQDADPQRLKLYTMQDWPLAQGEIEHSIQKYYPIMNELVMTDGTAMIGKQIIIHFTLQNQILEQLHFTHMSIEKTRPKSQGE